MTDETDDERTRATLIDLENQELWRERISRSPVEDRTRADDPLPFGSHRLGLLHESLEAAFDALADTVVLMREMMRRR